MGIIECEAEALSPHGISAADEDDANDPIINVNVSKLKGHRGSEVLVSTAFDLPVSHPL